MIYFLLLFLTLSLNAHQLKENYLHISYQENTKSLKMVLEVESRLLEQESIIDDNKNGIISFKELKAHKSHLTDYVKKHFLLFHKDEALSLNTAVTIFHRYQDQTYMQMNQTYTNIVLDDLKLNYSMFFELEDTHKLLIHLDDERGDYILSNDTRNYSFSSFKMSLSERISIFIKSGISHILDGLDHLLFILMILMPSIVFLHKKSSSQTIKMALLNILKVITTFSIAHSLTLFISGMGFWIPNTAFIESSIAFSIFVVALMNFISQYNHVNKKIVFLFGLLHGFGFANVLEIAKIDTTWEFLVALFGFNLGVEFGQIFVIILLLPFLYFLSKTKICLKGIKILSLIAMLISVFWFTQRVGLL